MIQFLLTAGCVLVGYYVMRKAVHHGTLDADRTLRNRELERRMQAPTQVRDEPTSDATSS